MAKRLSGLSLLALRVVCKEDRADRIFARSCHAAVRGNVRIIFHEQINGEEQPNTVASVRGLYFPTRGYKLS